MKTILLVLCLFGLLILAGGGAVHVWTEIGDVEMSTNGVIALILGTLFSLLLGGGLMFLVFLSSRRGHDDEASGR